MINADSFNHLSIWKQSLYTMCATLRHISSTLTINIGNTILVNLNKFMHVAMLHIHFILMLAGKNDLVPLKKFTHCEVNIRSSAVFRIPVFLMYHFIYCIMRWFIAIRDLTRIGYRASIQTWRFIGWNSKIYNL